MDPGYEDVIEGKCQQCESERWLLYTSDELHYRGVWCLARGDDSILDLRSVHKSVSLMSDVPPRREDDVSGPAMVILARG